MRRSTDIDSKPRIWNRDDGAVSLKTQPPVPIAVSGRTANSASPTPPTTGATSVLSISVLPTDATERVLDIEE